MPLPYLPPLKSDNLGNYSLFSDNSNLSIIANATTHIQLTNAHFNISGGTITKFSQDGLDKLVEAEAGVILDFPDIPGVTKIGDNAFQKNFTNKNIGIKLPDSITDIGKEAFRDNPTLTSIEFGNNLQRIGNHAFFQDSGITSIDLGDTITSIGDVAFRLCNITGELKLPSNLTNLGADSFGANKITKVVIPTTITKISNETFSENLELSNVVFHNGITVIGDRAFKNCKISGNPLNDLPNLKKLGDSCFENNYITSVTLPASIEKIGSYVFADNEITSADLTNLPNAIVDVEYGKLAHGIPRGLFANQSSNSNGRKQKNKLTSITLPNNIDTIGQNAFKGNNISQLEVPANITKIMTGAFEDNKTLADVTFHDDITEIGSSAFKNCSIYKESFELPKKLTTLGEGAFRNNKINKVTFPDDIVKIGAWAFAGNPVTEVVWGKFDKVDSVAEYRYTTYKTGKVIPEGLFAGHKINNITLPPNIIAIGGEAFQSQNYSLTEDLRIPENVEIIGVNAFFIDSPTETTIKNLTFLGNKVEWIDHGAFSSTYLLSGGMDGHITDGNLTIPESVKKIGDSAFKANRLKTLTFGNTEANIGHGAFSSSPTLTDVNRLDAATLGNYVFEGSLWEVGLKNVSFDYNNMNENFTSTSEYTFAEESLRSINIPKQITNINANAFNNNLDWYNNTASKHDTGNKVALYRVISMTTDGKFTYYTNNDITDGTNYVFNPVLVAFKLVDQDGNELSKSLLPESIKGKRFRPSEISPIDFVATTTSISGKELVDYNNFKLADKVEFVLPATPAGYTFEEVAVSDTTLAPVTPGNNKYEVELDPNNSNVVAETPYDDTYKVGYKKTVITLKYKKTNGGTNPPIITPTPPAITPTSPAITPTSPAVTPTSPAVTPTDPSVPVVPLPDTPTTPTTPTDPANPTIPPINPPTNVPFTPDRIINPNLIPEGDPTFNIVNEEDTPLGDAKIDKNKGTYTFVDDDSTPKGLAKIHDDNTLEVVKVYDDKAPRGTLPQTGGNKGSELILLGAAMLGLGVIIKRKTK